MDPKRTALALALALASTPACSEADCVTERCTPLRPDAAADGGIDGATDARADAGRCGVWERVDGCDGACPDPTTLDFGIGTAATAGSPELADPIAAAFDPRDPTRAFVLSSDGAMAEVRALGESLDFAPAFDLGIGLGIASSVGVSPDGRWAVASAIDDTCVPGTLYFVDLEEEPGMVLATTTVGVWPDHVAVSSDGRYVVSADEDQREPCKPASRRGGTISIVDVSSGPDSPEVVQTLAVDHALDSEPEGLAIGSRGTVAVTVQETDELILFDLADVPSATTTRIALPPGSRPDGVTVDDELGLAAVALERSDEIAIVSLSSESVVYVRDLVAEGDVPASYNRDARDVVEVHEPEEPVFFRYRGAAFLAVTVQESHAVLVYRVASDGTLVFDSVGPTGDYTSEEGGLVRSRIRPEGLAVAGSAGLALAVNEGEGSATLLVGGEARFAPCD